MNTNYKLSKWDCQIIHKFKMNCGGDNIEDELIAIWAERCLLNPMNICVKDITDHLLYVVFNSGLLNYDFAFVDFINNINSSDARPDFYRHLLTRLDILFTNATVDELPGYRQWLLDNNK